MAAYFTSDVHLRADRPDRGRRLSQWVGTLQPGVDRLTLVGDVCDFWFASRESRLPGLPCPGLIALAEFRQRGGRLTIMLGNHDAWMGPYYEERLGADVVLSEIHDEMVEGLRVRCLHGHLLGARSRWKGAMEGESFLKGFQSLPSPVAKGLAMALERSNSRSEPTVFSRHLKLFGEYTRSLAGQFDLVVFGHVHLAVDHPEETPRWVVLGDWKKTRQLFAG